MTPRDIENPPEDHSLGKGVLESAGAQPDSARSGAGGFEHVGDVLERAMLEIAKTMGWPLDPKARLVYWLAEKLTPEDMKTFIVRAAGEHVAMLLPCEAVALIKALDLEAA